MNSFWNEELSRLLYVKEMQLLKRRTYCARKPVRVLDQGCLLNEKLAALEHSGYIRKSMVRDLNTSSKPIFNFKKEDVNIVLYGYIRNEEGSGDLLHSLSGITSSKLQSEGKKIFFMKRFFWDNSSYVMVDPSNCTSIPKHYAHANITQIKMFTIQIMFLLCHSPSIWSWHYSSWLFLI